MIDFRNDSKWKVYIHISPSNKYYVGITSQKPNARWHNGNGYKYNEYFYRAIQKYGWDNFQHDIIAEHLTKDEACNFEKILIKKLDSNNNLYGYNLSSGGEGTPGIYGEKNHWFGKHHSDKTKEKISKIHKGKSLSAEHKNKLSITSKKMWSDETFRKNHSGKNAPCYGRIGKLHPMYGKHGEEIYNSKKVICLNTLETYESAVDASKDKNINSSKLSMCCRDERSYCGKDKDGNGLTWMYYSDYLDCDNEYVANKLKKAKENSKIRNSSTPVVNITTNEMFSSIKNAAKYIGIKSSCNISSACKTTGKKVRGSEWQYYEDYIKQNNLTDYEANKCLYFIC